MSRLLAIDYGMKRIGLAMSDELRIISSPYKTILNNAFLWDNLEEVIKSYKIGEIVLGIPYFDKESEMVIAVKVFSKELETKFALKVNLWDESLTSEEAKKHLLSMGKRGKKLKQNLDAFAAQCILENYLRHFS